MWTPRRGRRGRNTGLFCSPSASPLAARSSWSGLSPPLPSLLVSLSPLGSYSPCTCPPLSCSTLGSFSLLLSPLPGLLSLFILLFAPPRSTSRLSSALLKYKPNQECKNVQWISSSNYFLAFLLPLCTLNSLTPNKQRATRYHKVVVSNPIVIELV